MSFQKNLWKSDIASLDVSEAAGVVVLSQSLQAGAIIDLGFELAAQKFPAIAAEINAAKALIDAEVKKL